MAIFATKLALRHAPIATTTARAQCRGFSMKIRRVDARRAKPLGGYFLPTENPQNAREDAQIKHQLRLQAKQSGEHSDKAPLSASKSSIHENPALKIMHPPRLYKYDSNRWLAAREHAVAQDDHKLKESIPAVQRTTPKETSAGKNVRIRHIAISSEELELRNLDEELRIFDDELRSALSEYPLEAGTSDDITTGMFSPTKPRQSKPTPRRHLTPDILSELLGESSVAEPTQSSIPPLNLSPESVGLPPDVSWRPLADKDHQSFLHSDHIQNGTSPSEPLVSRLRDTATVLVLACASRTLALSDFIRLSPQGEHIEGWTSGIVRVIPGRNPTTLERTNHYFLVFSTSAAAAGYAENIDRLHTLSKKWTPDRPQHLGTPAPGVEIGKRGEDVGALVRSFTLLPNTQPRAYIRRLQKPYRPAIARVIETGAYHSILAQEKDMAGENLVLFQLDDGLMSRNDLMKVIEADGRRRNLNWRLEGNGEGDILHYGGGGKNDASRDEADWEDAEGGNGERRKRRSGGDNGVYPRHIVRFRDAVEAKRFVRAWHSRTLEGDPWDTLAAKGQWAGGKVSAEILW